MATFDLDEQERLALAYVAAQEPRINRFPLAPSRSCARKTSRPSRRRHRDVNHGGARFTRHLKEVIYKQAETRHSRTILMVIRTKSRRTTRCRSNTPLQQRSSSVCAPHSIPRLPQPNR
jgi:hypothetical protein